MSLLLPLLVVAVFLGHWPTSQSLFHVWSTHAAFGHGPVVVAFLAWWFWREVPSGGSAARPSPAGWLALAAVAVAWLLLQLAEFQAPAQALLPLLVLASLWAAGGWALARRALLPVALLWVTVSAWSLLVPLLQSITAQMSTLMVRATGVELVREGTLVHVAAGTFAVAEGCSGLNFLVASVTLAGCLALWWRLALADLLRLVGGAVAMAMVANWVRVAVLIWLGDATQMQHPWVANEHYSLGWLLFAAFFFPFLWVMSSRVKPQPAPAREPGDTGLPPLAVGGALLVGTLAPVALYYALAGLPQAAGPQCESTGIGWYPASAGADRSTCATEAVGSASVRRHTAWFAPERLGHELEPGQRRWVPDGAWVLAPVGSAGESAGWRGFEARQGMEVWQLRVRESVGDIPVSGTLDGKRALLLERLAGRRPASRRELLAAPCIDGCAAVGAALDQAIAP